MITSDLTPTVVLVHGAFVVATADHAIHPNAERDMAKRADSEITEINSSHAVPATHPADVAAVIVGAVTAMR